METESQTQAQRSDAAGVHLSKKKRKKEKKIRWLYQTDAADIAGETGPVLVMTACCMRM